ETKNLEKHPLKGAEGTLNPCTPILHFGEPARRGVHQKEGYSPERSTAREENFKI
ncbi:hypothetical protein P7K49_018418, partial [Saguinus oedipus]